MTLTERADLIESGRLRWVRGTPEKEGECCLAWNATPPELDGYDALDGAPDLWHEPTWVLTQEQADAITAILEREQGYIGDPHTTVSNWNDAKGRTKEQVVAVLRKAAAALGEVPS